MTIINKKNTTLLIAAVLSSTLTLTQSNQPTAISPRVTDDPTDLTLVLPEDTVTTNSLQKADSNLDKKIDKETNKKSDASTESDEEQDSYSTGKFETEKNEGVGEDEILLDAIEVIVGTDQGTHVITKSELIRPGLQGEMQSKNDIIMKWLMYDDSLKFQQTIDEEKIDRQLKAIQKEYNLTLDQLKEIFKNAGYTFEEGRMEFAIMSAVNELLGLRVYSRLAISEQEIQAYYDGNPVVLPTVYTIERAVVPFDDEMTTEEQLAQLATLSARKRAQLPWGRSFTITKAELAEEKHFITDLAAGEVSAPHAGEDGIEFFKMISINEDQVVPLDERKTAIAELLRKERYEKLMKEYTDTLFKEASIIEL